MATSISPSRFWRTITIGNRLCIISATAQGVKLGSGTEIGGALNDFPAGILIFTDKLTLYSAKEQDNKGYRPAFSIHKQPFILSATDVRILPEKFDDQVPAVFLTANGTAGTANLIEKPDDDRTAATNGNQAGNISFFASNYSIDTAKNLAIQAVGGEGATTADLDTPAGRGGSGGTVTFYAWTSVRGVSAMIQSFEQKYMPNEWTEALKTKVKPIKTGHMIFTEIANLVEDATLRCANVQGDELRQFLGPLEDIMNNLTSRDITLWDIGQACQECMNQIEDAVTDSESYQYGKISVRGGPGGQATFRDPMHRGINGEKGPPGTKSVTFDSQNPTNFPFMHPLQCRMILDKAKAYFYFDDVESRAQALRLVSDLLSKLSVVPDKGTNETSKDWSSLEQTYENWLDILDLPPEVSIRSAFESIKTDASELYNQLTATSVDMYGYSKDWAPRMSVQAINTEIQAALLHLQQTEETNAKYLKALDDAVDREQKISEQQTSITEMGKRMKKDLDDLVSHLNELWDRIKDTVRAQEIELASFEAKNELDKLKSQISSELKLSPASILKACEMLAFSKSVPMIATQAGNLGLEVLTSVPNVSDVPIKKDVIIGRVKNVDASLQSVWDSSGLTENGDGTFKSNDREVSKLVLQEDNMDKLLNDFQHTSFAGQAKKAIEKLKAFIKLSSDKNKDIIDYNFTLRKALNHSKAKRELELKQNMLERQKFLRGSIPTSDLRSAHALVESFHDASRSRVMKLLSTMQRAIRFSSLVDVTELLENYKMPTDAELEMNHAVLSTRIDKLHGKLFDLTEKAGSNATTFPEDPKDRGKMIELTADQCYKLVTEKEVDVKIAPIYANTATEGKFKGQSEIRIWKVHCWLRGLKVKNSSDDNPPQVSIKITHGGKSTFVSQDDDEFLFEHAPVSVTFSYTLDASGKTSILDSGAMVNESKGDPNERTTYVAPALFTTWAISLENLDTTVFDLESLNGCYLEFYGTERPFRSVTRNGTTSVLKRPPRRVGGRQGDAAAGHFFK